MIDQEDYRLEKKKLLLQKKSLEEEIYNLSHKQNDWLEPFQNWLEVAQNIDKIASDSDLFAKKVCAKEIFGSNLRLGEKTVRASALDSGNSLAIPPKNPWHALCAFRLGSGSEPFSSFAVGERGLEPPRLAPPVPKTGVFTNYTTRPVFVKLKFFFI